MVGEWFLATPEELEVNKIDLNLGLRGSIRYYNDLVAPGIGGVTFVRQLTWSCLAIMYAKSLKVSAIKLGNAIEALGLKAYFDSTISTDYNYRGKRAFNRSSYEGLNSFKSLSKKQNYVQITYRQNTTRSLPEITGLGLVEGDSGFERFHLSQAGQALISAYNENYKIPSIETILINWIEGLKPTMNSKSVNERFGPIATNSEKTEILNRLNSSISKEFKGLRNDTPRRKNIINIFERIGEEWGNREFIEMCSKNNLLLLQEDLIKALDFFEMLKSGQLVLRAIYSLLEKYNGELSIETNELDQEIEILIEKCRKYILHGNNKPEADAFGFANCMFDNRVKNSIILQEIANRDQQVCMVVENKIVKGPLFRSDIMSSEDIDVDVPKNLRNFYSLWKDANGK